MDADHRELRSALERCWAAKRALQEAYRRSEASHVAAEPPPTPGRHAAEQAANPPATRDELEALKGENTTLRRSLTLLLAHSLGLHERLEALLVRERATSAACEAAAPTTREAARPDGYPTPST